MQKSLATYVKDTPIAGPAISLNNFPSSIPRKRLLSAQISGGSESESGTWMYASTRQPFNILPDDVFCDEVTFRLGLPPPIRAYCAKMQSMDPDESVRPNPSGIRWVPDVESDEWLLCGDGDVFRPKED